MIDFNILSALIIMGLIVVFVKFVMPYLRKNNVDFYEEIKLGLLLFGHIYRDDKIKNISKVALEVVRGLEELSLTSAEKHYLAVDEVFRRLLFEFDIELPEEAIELIIRAAVSQLPPTNK